MYIIWGRTIKFLPGGEYQKVSKKLFAEPNIKKKIVC